jgi:hypothetical protein
VTLDDLVRWREAHREEVARFLHHHRELSGIHYMADDAGNAYVEFSLKSEMETGVLEAEIAADFQGVDCRITVVDPEAF